MRPLGDPLAQGLAVLGLEARGAHMQRLLDYLQLLQRWNRVYNLTAITSPEDMIRLHLLDSLAVVPFLRGTSHVDVGSGAGLPGIPLAIWLPDFRFTLLDSSGRKTRFLVQAKIELGLTNVEVVQERVEHWRPSSAFDGVLSRAFSSLSDFVSQAGHLVQPQGALYALKGSWPEPAAEPLPSPFFLRACRALEIPGISASRHLIEVGVVNP